MQLLESLMLKIKDDKLIIQYKKKYFYQYKIK